MKCTLLILLCFLAVSVYSQKFSGNYDLNKTDGRSVTNFNLQVTFVDSIGNYYGLLMVNTDRATQYYNLAGLPMGESIIFQVYSSYKIVGDTKQPIDAGVSTSRPFFKLFYSSGELLTQWFQPRVLPPAVQFRKQ